MSANPGDNRTYIKTEFMNINNKVQSPYIIMLDLHSTHEYVAQLTCNYCRFMGSRVSVCDS